MIGDAVFDAVTEWDDKVFGLLVLLGVPPPGLLRLLPFVNSNFVTLPAFGVIKGSAN